MTIPDVAHETPLPPHQRFWKAYYAAGVTVLVMASMQALRGPDGLGAAIWFTPLKLLLVTLCVALPMALVAMLNITVFVRPVATLRGAWWRHGSVWAYGIVYGALLLYVTWHVTASGGLEGRLLGLFTLGILTVFNWHFQRTAHPHRLLLGIVAVVVLVPAYLLLRPIPRVSADSPIIWVTHDYNFTEPTKATPVYWPEYRQTYLQWKGRNYRLRGISSSFAVLRDAVITLEGRDLVVRPLHGTPRRFSLKAQIPNYERITAIEPTRGGVLLNIYASASDIGYRVVRVNFKTGMLHPVPRAWRVRGAETTDRYMVSWSEDHTHQVRDGHDRLVRQHGIYPWHFRDWNADPVDDLFAITTKSDVTLIGPDSFTMSTINPGMSVGSITMQPGRHQLWIAQATHNDWSGHLPPCRVVMYSYSGRRLGQRTLLGPEVLRAMPVDEEIAAYLVQKYGVPVAQ